MPKHGKNYKAAAAKVDSTKLYSPKEAMELAKELSPAKFDETVEVAVRLGVDTRKADQNVRGSIALPHGTGKTVRVAVFAEGEKAREAEAAGADVIGSDDLVAQIQAGELNFDAAIATPNMMGKVGRLGKILGPRGLMPNPKLGRPAASSTAPTATASATSRWARCPSTPRSSSRTTARSSTSCSA